MSFASMPFKSKLTKSVSSSSIQSTVSTFSSGSDGCIGGTAQKQLRRNPLKISKRIYEAKEEEDLSEHIEFAQRNICLYRYAKLEEQNAKLKEQQTELEKKMVELKQENEQFQAEKNDVERRRILLRKIQLLKSALDCGENWKQFAQVIEPHVRELNALPVQDEEFDQLKETVETHKSKYIFHKTNHEKMKEILNSIEQLNLEEQFVTKICDMKMYEKIKNICKQSEQSNQKLLELKQQINLYRQILDKLENTV